MEKRRVDPWTWQERLGYAQAWRVDGASSTIFLAGQGPSSADGALVGEGDFDAQARQAHANVATVLEQAGASFDDVVKLTVYLTDIGRLRDFGRVRAEFVGGEPPASTALEVGALAWPGMMVEVDAVAVL
jgi:enamine deaminase RidA (YjgF/YER057c/UK114 family)